MMISGIEIDMAGEEGPLIEQSAGVVHDVTRNYESMIKNNRMVKVCE